MFYISVFSEKTQLPKPNTYLFLVLIAYNVLATKNEAIHIIQHLRYIIPITRVVRFVFSNLQKRLLQDIASTRDTSFPPCFGRTRGTIRCHLAMSGTSQYIFRIHVSYVNIYICMLSIMKYTCIYTVYIHNPIYNYQSKMQKKVEAPCWHLNQHWPMYQRFTKLKLGSLFFMACTLCLSVVESWKPQL